jgi:2-keto-4-pentenoate hydratase
MSPTPTWAEQAAAELLRQHRQGERFTALSVPAPLSDVASAYAVQDALVRGKCAELHSQPAGYKIALTTAAMQAMVGFEGSISGHLLACQIQSSGASLQAAHYGRLALEFEIAFIMKADLPARAKPWDHDIAQYIAQAVPALELVDDRRADYARLRQDILTLVADNAWNAGLVMGEPIEGAELSRLDQICGVACIDGVEVGRGKGSDVLGHPLTALAWLANHLTARGLGLRRGDIVTTGSLVKSQFPQAGSQVVFQLDGAAPVSASVI